MFQAPVGAAPTSIQSKQELRGVSPSKAEYPYLYNKKMQHDDGLTSAEVEVDPDNRHQSHSRAARSPSPSSRIDAVKKHPSYLPQPVSISRPSASIASTEPRRQTPERQRGTTTATATTPLEQFKLAATLTTNQSKTRFASSAANSNQYRPRASSESPLRSKRPVHDAPAASSHPAATTPIDGTTTRGRQFNGKATTSSAPRSSSVPRRHPSDDPSHHQQQPNPAKNNRFYSLVEERRQQYDQRARGSSPIPKGGYHAQNPLDVAKDFYQKAGLVRPASTASKNSNNPSNRNERSTTSPGRAHVRASPAPSKQQTPTHTKPDPDVVTFKKDPEPAAKAGQLPHLQKKRDPIATTPQKPSVRGFNETEETRHTAARYEKSTIHKMLSEKRPAKHQPSSSLMDSNNNRSVEKSPPAARKPQSEDVTDPDPLSFRGTQKQNHTNSTTPSQEEPKQRAAPSSYSAGIRSYGFAERLSNQLARTEADRKSSITTASTTATSLATPSHTAHPVFGYSGKTATAYSKTNASAVNHKTQKVSQRVEQIAEKTRAESERRGAIRDSNNHNKAHPVFGYTAPSTKVKSTSPPTVKGSVVDDQEDDRTGDNKHPVFGYVTRPGKESRPAIQNRDSMDEQLEVDDDIDVSEESELSCVRRSRHLSRVMRPKSARLVHSESPTTKRKVTTTTNHADDHRQFHHRRDVAYTEHEHGHVGIKRVRSSTTSPNRMSAISPSRRRPHEYQERDYRISPNNHLHNLPSEQQVFSMGQHQQRSRDTKSKRRSYPYHDDPKTNRELYDIHDYRRHIDYRIEQSMHDRRTEQSVQNRRSASAGKLRQPPRTRHDRYYDGEPSDHDYSTESILSADDLDQERVHYDFPESPPCNSASQLHQSESVHYRRSTSEGKLRQPQRNSHHDDESSDHDYSTESIKSTDDLNQELVHYDIPESPPYNTASQLHNELERRRPTSVGNREPGGVYGTDDVSSFMRVQEPPGPIDPPDPEAENYARRTKSNKNEKAPVAHYESFRSLEERRRMTKDAPSGRSFLGPQSSHDTSSHQASTVDNSENSRGESALLERAQNEQALEDLLHEKAKRMGRYQAEAMDESSDSRADAFIWLHQKYGTKAPTMNMKAIEKAKTRASRAKLEGNQKKTEVVSKPILEDDEDIFSGLDDLSSFSKKASPTTSPKEEVSPPRLAKSPKITIRKNKTTECSKHEKNPTKTFQDAIFSNTIISDLTMSLTTEKRKCPKSPSKPITEFSEIEEEVGSNDDSSAASPNGCKRTAFAMTDLGQTLGKSIVASFQRASCNVPEKIPVPQCDMNKARCEHRINEAWGLSNEDKESLTSHDDNSTVTDTMLNEMEKRIWAAWDRRRTKPSEDTATPATKTTAFKSVNDSTTLHVETASTASSENKEDNTHYERSEAKAALLQYAQKAVEMYGSHFPNVHGSQFAPMAAAGGGGTLAKLHSIDSSTHRPKPTVSLAAGTPVSKLSTTMTFEDQAMLEGFSSALKNTGVEVLKLGRKNKWQVRYLTVSKEVTKLSTGGVAGDIGQCPMALLWPKSFKGHNFSVATIKENGRGGVLFKHLKKVRATASNEFYDHHLSKKLKASFPEFAGVVLDYLHDSGARQLHLCFKSNAEAQAFITAMLIIREATERSEGGDPLQGDVTTPSYATNSIEELEQ